MLMAFVLFAILVASLLFHFVSPWQLAPLASNWKQMDDTLTITFAITGVFFVAVSLFLVYTLVRYRHREGLRAAYEPENRRLERWLIVLTTIGIVGLLAPGLVVYADYVRPPKDAMVVEVLGRQWQWMYRFPGEGGKLGRSDMRFVTPDNPFGLDPDDPNGRDNLLVAGGELHLPLNRPVKVLLRSQDVLHDFYVPQFRARMNMVPGLVTSFWFTPTEAGRFEVLCAQLCGVGHSNMRGAILVEDETAFRSWLQAQSSYETKLAAAAQGASALPVGAPGSGTDVGAGDPNTALGRGLSQSKGCLACHSVDGSPGVGPTWKGLHGKSETLADGSQVVVDEDYLRRAIREPNAQVAKGFAPIMPPAQVSDDELAALVRYIESLGK